MIRKKLSSETLAALAGSTALTPPPANLPARVGSFRYRERPKPPAIKPFQPSAQQADFLKWVEHGRGSVLLEAVAGAGKCLGRGTPVLMHDGRVVAVEDIAVGDILMGPDSQPRRVLSTTRGRAPLYRIVPRKGDAWVCNDVHILTLIQSETDEIFDIPLNEYHARRGTKSFGRLKDAKLFRVPVDFPERETPIEPYMLGLWLGDGTTELPEIHSADPEIIDYCREEAAYYGAELVELPQSGCVSLRFRVGPRGTNGRNKEHMLWREFKRCLVNGQKRIPSEYLVAGFEARFELLAGIIDTDGWYDGKHVSIVTKLSGLADDYLFLCRSLGFAAYKRAFQVKGGTYYNISVSGHLDAIPTKLPRKQARPRLQKKDVLRTAFTTEALGEGDYFGFTLDGDGRFLLGDFTVTHNTTTLVEGLRLMEGGVFFGAYNKKIAEEIKAKAEERGVSRRGLYISTFHGVGFAAWKEKHPKSDVDDAKVRKICERLADEGRSAFELTKPFICKMVSFGKQFIVGVKGKASIDDKAYWARLSTHFGCDQDLPDDIEIDKALDYVIEVYRASAAACEKIIDFDDMIFAPLYFGARFFPNHWVLIDERQDINPARRELAKRMLRRDGRLVAVGDSRQAIYGFCHPPGTLIKTPCGHRPIEELRIGDPIIASPVSGEVVGFSGGHRITETHQYHHSGFLLTLEGGGRKVTMTPHHKVPAQLDPDAQYYTYMMRSNGCFRVGYCAAYAEAMGMFMLMARVGTEKADATWILAGHPDKAAAVAAENRLLMRVKGTTFSTRTPDEIAALPTDEAEALKILGEHGRMVDFPLWTPQIKHRFARNGCIVTEACNLMDGMRFVFFDEAQSWGGKSGRRQRFVWTPFTVSARYYSGPVYGITIPAARHPADSTIYPLYFAGDDILVHNTGADGGTQKFKDDFGCVEMPLTVTYRCPKAVVEYVRQWVSHIEAHPEAPEGVVRPVLPPQPGKPADGRPWFLRDAPTPQDAILCRLTRPLIQTAFAMLRNGVACKVEGRDIGKNLISLARMWKISSLDALEKRLAQWLAREIEKARAAKSDAKELEVTDRADTLKVFIERCREKGMSRIDQLVAEIEAIFADDVKGVVTLSTGHKSKGREWPRVYWIVTPDRQKQMREWEYVQEQNVKYVIGTRAQSELILVPEGTP